MNFLSPRTHKIWLLILPSGCGTFPCKLVFENFVSDQDNKLYLISLSILISRSISGYFREKLHIEVNWLNFCLILRLWRYIKLYA